MLERILIGLLYIVMDTIGLIAVIIIIVTIILEPPLRRSQCYRMILYICLLDSIQLFIALISGFLTLWPLEGELSTKLAGALFEPLWICMIFFIFILSIERLSIITNDQTRRRRVSIVCTIMSVISTLIGMTFFITFLTPWVTMRYEVSTYAWRYIRSPVSFVVAMTEACSLTPLSLISLVNYIAIFVAICHKKKHARSRIAVTSSERRILVQSIALFSFTTTGVFFDFFNFYLLPSTKWMFFALNLIRQTCIVMVPILNLIFNVSLRKKAVEHAKYAINRLFSPSATLERTKGTIKVFPAFQQC